MSDETTGTSAIRNYLLGNLPESEAEEIERLYFADSQRVDEVWVVFGAIAEEYLCADLSEIESRRFEQRLRSLPALREMFENEKALFDYSARIINGASQHAEPSASIEGAGLKMWMPTAFFKPPQLMAAGVIALIGLGALITWFALMAREGAKPGAPTQTQNRSQQADVNAQNSPDRNAQPSIAPQQAPQSGRGANDKLVEEKGFSKAPSDQPKSASGISPETTATFLLLAAGTRGGQSDPKLGIPARTDTVHLELELPNDDCAVFSAALQTESNEEIQRWDTLRARIAPSSLRVVSLRIRANSLKNAGYVIKLDCVSNQKNTVSAGEYRFKVEKK